MTVRLLRFAPALFLLACMRPARPTAPVEVPAHPAKLVWLDESGAGRLQVGLFRRDVRLSQRPRRAQLSLFADSHYLLFVNGAVVATGPARHYPEHPEYDSVDLTPHLVAGANVIGVKVLSNGTFSYQVRRMPAAFVAWGEIEDESGARVDLATPGDWRARRERGYDPDAPHMSFATGPIEVYDARAGEPGWLNPDLDLSSWQGPVPLARQRDWGPLRPRSIPFLTQDLVLPRALLGVHAFDERERLHSFRIKLPDQSRDEYGGGRTLLAYTYIHAPRAQDVEVALWWGDHYLNGEGPLAHEPGSEARNRRRFRLHLREGWNHFFVKQRAIWGGWDFFMAVPSDAGLTLSPRKQFGDGDAFLTAGPFAPVDEAAIGTLPMPLEPSDMPASLASAWRPQRHDQPSPNPALQVTWRTLGAALAHEPWRTHDITVPAGQDRALVLDMGGKQLGRLVLDYDAPAGTTVDIGWSEDLEGVRPNVLKRSGLFTGARHVAVAGHNEWQTVKPYGLRYLHVNVSGHSAPVHLRRIGVVRQVYPFEKLGHFTCSDPLLNAIWELGWRTLEVCAEDSYTDTPFRERGLYAGDALPEMAITLAGARDLRLVKRSLRLFRDMYAPLFEVGRPFHPDETGLLADFPLITLEIFRWYVERTGENDFARELYPAYRHLVDMLLAARDRDGLVERERVFIEWSEIEKHNVKNTGYNALLSRACTNLAALSRRLGDDDRGAGYDKSAAELRAAVQAGMWDDGKGAFRDGIKHGTPIDSHYPISSAWPMLWGLTTPEQDARIAPHFTAELADIGAVDRRQRSSPYGGFYVLGALYRNQQARVAEDFMRKHWGPMVTNRDDTAYENFGDTGIGTLSHAWSGGPTFHLTTQVLGVDLGYPDFRHPDDVLIAPQADTIDWARGAVPHPRGLIEVDWRVEGDALVMNVKVPAGVKVRVEPRGRLGKLRLVVNGGRG